MRSYLYFHRTIRIYRSTTPLPYNSQDSKAGTVPEAKRERNQG